MASIGEQKLGISFKKSAETMEEVLKHQGAEWIDMAETFKKDNPFYEKDALISEAQEAMKSAIELLVKAIKS